MAGERTKTLQQKKDKDWKENFKNARKGFLVVSKDGESKRMSQNGHCLHLVFDCLFVLSCLVFVLFEQ